MTLKILQTIEKIIKEFSKKGLTLALAESCTGGYISNMITNVSGSSNIFDRGYVVYSNAAKVDMLNINPEDIEKEGAVSEIVAEQLARNTRLLSNVDIGIGITGIAGPTGGTPEKPVGLVYIGFSTAMETIVKKFIFNTSRTGFKIEVLKIVLDFLENKL
jgi:nicotinamide-nucleotide amidase